MAPCLLAAVLISGCAGADELTREREDGCVASAAARPAVAHSFGFAVQASAGWHLRSTGMSPTPPQAPVALAANVPVAPETVDVHDILAGLPGDGVVVAAYLFDLVDEGGRPRSLSLPLRLEDFEVRERWETQPKPSVQARIRFGTVNDRLLDVRVFFGTQDPDPDARREAQLVLGCLVLPGPAT